MCLISIMDPNFALRTSILINFFIKKNKINNLIFYLKIIKLNNNTSYRHIISSKNF